MTTSIVLTPLKDLAFVPLALNEADEALLAVAATVLQGGVLVAHLQAGKHVIIAY